MAGIAVNILAVIGAVWIVSTVAAFASLYLDERDKRQQTDGDTLRAWMNSKGHHEIRAWMDDK